ncbi:MucR family transcriptional regulator [Sphingobium bisphenolivorans]|uniref:MucR family transcriptional regulator n=1 Tax=Sphingobium bisphenolivorans TaxID=1335760 RepID=UPI00039E81D6|nr:MucR family transcriptional regulator [Sphingobium bisphenolivorans]
MSENNQIDITTLTVQLLSAFVSNNSVPSENLAELIRTTRSALTEEPTARAAEAASPTYTPAVSVRKSLSSPDHILSMIDGKPYKTLKRHLATHGLTGEEYRERYNLPKSYPLVAPTYSEARRAVATKLGLGRKTPETKSSEAKPATEAAPAPKVPAAKSAPAKSASAKPAVAKAAPAPKPVDAAAPGTAAPEAAPAKAAPSRKRLSIASPAEGKEKSAPKAAKPAAASGDKKAAAPKAAKKKPAPKADVKAEPSDKPVSA